MRGMHVLALQLVENDVFVSCLFVFAFTKLPKCVCSFHLIAAQPFHRVRYSNLHGCVREYITLTCYTFKSISTLCTYGFVVYCVWCWCMLENYVIWNKCER